MRDLKSFRQNVLFRQIVCLVVAGVFLFTNTLSWGDASSGPADKDKLAPPLGSKSEALKARFLAGEILLSHKRYNEYIAKKIEEIGYAKLLKTSVPINGVEGETELISIPGLLKFTALPAHVGLGQKYHKPVIYIDSGLYYNDDIRQHEFGEVSGWEGLRKLLGLIPAEMRDWIMQNIDTPVNDERLEGTEYYGKTTRQIAEIIHRRAHELPHYLHKELAGKIDYENLATLTMYDDEETEYKKDVTIAAQERGKRESKPASIIAGDGTDGKTKKAGSPQEKKRFERISRYIRAKFALEYGELAEDHPVTRYVRSVFEEMMTEDAGDYRVIVAPAWNQINAVALPDGTIIISRRLLDFVEYKEELQGVLAHEVTHIRRRHAEAREKLIRRAYSDITIESILDTIGLIRLQETEADLRWVVEQLKAKGMNPFGYQIFLERFNEFKQSSGTAISPDWKHGGLDERALNIESIFHYIDLESLSRDLTRIPADGEFKTMLQAVRQANKLTLWTGLPTHLSKDEIEMACQEGIALAGQMPASHIGIALKNFVAANINAINKLEELYEELLEKQEELGRLKDAHQELKDAGKSGARRAELKEQIAEIRSDIAEIRERIEKLKIIGNGYKELCEICVNRINDEVITGAEWMDENQRRLARSLYYNLYSNIRYFEDLEQSSLPPALWKQYLADKKMILSEDEMRRLPGIMTDNRFHKLPITCLIKGPSDFLEDVINAYMKIKGIETKPTKKGVDDCVDFAASFTNALEDLYNMKGRVKVRGADLFAKAAGLIKDPLRLKYPGLMKRVDEREASLGKTKKIQRESMQYGLHKEAVLIMDMISKRARLHKRFVISDYRDVLMRIEMLARQYRMNVSDIINLFLYISNVEFEDYDPEKIDPSQLEMIYAKTAAMDYALFRLFEDTVNAFNQFTSLAPLAKETLLLNGLAAFAYHECELKLGKGSSGESILIPGDPSDPYEVKVDGETALTLEDNEYLEMRRKTVEKIWLRPKRPRQEVFELYNGLVESAIKVSVEPITRDIFIRILANYLTMFTDWGAFFAEVEALEKIGVPASKLIMENKDAFGLALANLWTTLPEDPSPEEARQILLATNFVESPFLRSQLQAYYYDMVWQWLDFDAKLDALFSREAGGFFDLRRFNDFVEKEAMTERELHQVLERINSEYDALIAEGSGHAGILTIFSMIGQDSETMQELILALLTTGEGDLALKDLVYKKVKDYSLTVSVHPTRSLLYLSSEFSGLIDSSEKIVNGLYSMDTAAKYILLRKILTGERGLLSNPQHRERFLKALVARIIDDRTEPDLRETINRTISVLGKNPEWKHLYFGLQPIILNKIAIPPERPTPWSKVPSVAEDVDYMEGHGVKDPFGTARETLITALASDHKDRPWRFEKGLVRYSENILRNKLEKIGIITPLKRTERMSPLSFVIEAAQNTGSLGVRFLQLLPQFIPNVTADYQDKFSRVYDSVHGQSKASAMGVLEREWQGFWNDVESIGECVGGGSMATVFHIRTKAGRDEVVKVLNPNLKFFLESRAEFMAAILNEMSRRYGGEYEMARFVLDDVVEWIERDADFKGFLEKDRRFRDEMGNNGFTVKGSQYSMYVPRSFAVPGREGTPYVIREEFINDESRNLTEWDALIREGNDMKDIISLIVRNYVKQLHDGLVHSDVHVGNFRVTRDKKVAILDRNLYLELNSDIKELITSNLLNPAALFTLSAEALLDKILNVSTTKEITPAQRERLVQTINIFLNNIKKTGSISEVGSLLVNLRRNGLKLPLEVTLIFKNLNALQQMAVRAGFTGGILEAYLYPDTREETSSSAAGGKVAKRKEPPAKGSCADCLETIRNSKPLADRGDRTLFELALDREEGITVGEATKQRSEFTKRTVYKEFNILKSLGIFVPIEGKRGYYKFSDMMIGPDENYTKTLINAISDDIEHKVGKRGEIRVEEGEDKGEGKREDKGVDRRAGGWPLRRGSIPDGKIALVKELVKMTILHQINLMQRPAIPEGKVLWHILEQDVVSVSQQSSFAQVVNNAAERSKAPERIYVLKKGELINDAIARISRDHPNVVFDIALSQESHIENVPGDIKRLVFEGGAGDVAQLGGIIAALRTLHGPKEDIIPTLKRIYAALKGSACQYEIPPDALDDPVRFARSFIFHLPPATPIPIEEIPRMNERLLKLLVAA